MTSQLVVKLTHGDTEVNLTDLSSFYLQEFSDAGELLTMKLTLTDPDSYTERIKLLLHQFDMLNQAAIDYLEGQSAEPVYLAVKEKDGTSKDTVFGRGFRYRMLGGRGTVKEAAISYTVNGRWQQQLLAASAINDVELTLRCRARHNPQNEPVYPWETKRDRWLGQAQGSIRTSDHGSLFIDPATTNKATNTQFDNEADRDAGWSVSDVALTVTENTDPAYIYAGFASIILDNGHASAQQFYQSVNVGNTNKHSLQVRVRRLDGGTVSAAVCRLFYNVVLTTTFTADDNDSDWYWLTAENVTGINAATNFGLQVEPGYSVAVDCFQIEEKVHCSPYCYGNLGRGHAFSGAAHTTTSVRTVGGVFYRNAVGTVPLMLPRVAATVSMIVKAPFDSDDFEADAYLFYCGSMRLHYDQANTRFEFTDGTNTAVTGAATFSADDSLHVFAEYGANGLRVEAYALGGSAIATAGTAASYAAPAPNAAFWLGSDSTPAGHWEAEILELQIYDGELTATERSARVAKGRGSAELPVVWSHTGTGVIYNSNDETDDEHDWIELLNGPGDDWAGLKLLLTQQTASQTPLYLYAGMTTNGFPIHNDPHRRLLRGWQCKPFLQAEDGSASFDGDTVLATDAGASGGASNNCSHTTPSTTDEVTRIQIPIATEPEDLAWYYGYKRLLGRFLTAEASHHHISYKVVTGYAEGPDTKQFYASGDNTWQTGDDREQILCIPSHYIPPYALQRYYVPGDWSGATYCYLELNVEADAASGDLYCDGVLLLPHDYEAYAELPSTSSWPQNRVVVLDTCSRDYGGFTAYDVDTERMRDRLDLWNSLHLPNGQPAAIVFCWLRSGTGAPWNISDQIKVEAKYRPRYKQVR